MSGGTSGNLALPAGGIRRPHATAYHTRHSQRAEVAALTTPRGALMAVACGNAWSLADMSAAPERLQEFSAQIQKTKQFLLLDYNPHGE